MIRLRCNRCGTTHEYSDSKLEFDCVGSDQRSMGTENAYSGEMHEECHNCHNKMNVTFDWWEYPTLFVNYSEYNVFGCTVVEEPDYKSFLHRNENYYED